MPRSTRTRRSWGWRPLGLDAEGNTHPHAPNCLGLGRFVFVSLCLTLAGAGCHNDNPAYFVPNQSTTSKDVEDTKKKSSKMDPDQTGTQGAGDSQHVDTKGGTTSAGHSNEPDTTSTTDAPTQDTSTQDSGGSDTSSTTTPEPMLSDYCNNEAALCLNLYDPSTLGAGDPAPDKLTFTTGPHAQFKTQTDASKEILSSWLEFNGDQHTQSRERLEILGMTQGGDNDMGFDAWVWRENVVQSALAIEIENLMGLGVDEQGRVVCNAYSNSPRVDWARLSSIAFTPGKWIHVACIYQGKTVHAWVPGASENPVASYHSAITINVVTSAQLLIGTGTWVVNNVALTKVDPFKGRVAGIRIWSDIEKMTDTLTREAE